MNIYKITNITNLLGKRKFNSNKPITIKYVDKMEKKNVELNPNEVLYLEIDKLPISIHELRVKGYITVSLVREIPKESKTVNTEIKKDEKKTYKRKTKTTSNTNEKAE